nr:MAG TPA: hypothetical protein [Caudoviricetes sp.]
MALELLVADALSLIFRGRASAWGIYRGGAPVVRADNVVAFDFRKQWAISDYPVERGSFESYDKVEVPYGTRLRFSAGGNEGKQQALLSSIAAIAGDLKLYNVVTPAKVYLNANIERYDYAQTATNGVGLMQVDVTIIEIREVGGGMLSATKSPSVAGLVNGGPVQAVAPSPAVTRLPGTGSNAPGGF